MDNTPKTPEDIIGKALEDWKPSHVVVLCSFGDDSMALSHYVHTKMAFDVPLLTYAIDTKLGADGWLDWIRTVDSQYGWGLQIYDNQSGFEDYVEWVRQYGQPFSPPGHKIAYRYLKDRAIDAILRDYKTNRFDKILFLSGVRKYESREREKIEDPIHRKGSKTSPMNAIFASPLFYWQDEDVLRYRIENELPTNPFYETVGGSGDCQCNWGYFINLRKLQKESPCLAGGNVATLDKVSMDNHGYGWDGRYRDQPELFDDYEDDGEMTSPFLCAGCSRAKSPRPGKKTAEEEAYIQSALW